MQHEKNLTFLSGILLGEAIANMLHLPQHSPEDPILTISQSTWRSLYLSDVMADLGHPSTDYLYEQVEGIQHGEYVRLPVPADVRLIVDDKSDGFFVRSLFLAFVYQGDPAYLRQILSDIPVLLNGDDPLIASCLATASLIRHLLVGNILENCLATCAIAVAGIDEDFDQSLRRLGHVQGWGSHERAIRHLLLENKPHESFALGLYCMLRFPQDYWACVSLAASRGAQPAAFASAIFSLHNGPLAIPAHLQLKSEALKAHLGRLSNKSNHIQESE